MLAWPGRAPASGNMGVNCPVRPLVGFRRPAGLAQGELVAPGWVTWISAMPLSMASSHIHPGKFPICS